MMHLLDYLWLLAACVLIAWLSARPWSASQRRKRRLRKELDRLIDPSRQAGVVSYIEDARRRRAL